MSKANLVSLVTCSGGVGSHFILYKLSGHPSIATLKELSFKSQGGTTKRDLKSWMSGDKSSLFQLQNEQLEPKMAFSDPNLKWLFVNKPTIKNCIYHRAYCEKYPMFYIFRNPMSFYYTWKGKWEDYTDSRSLPRMSKQKTFDWFATTLMSSLFEYSQFYDKEQDYVISFEHFFSNIDKELENIFRILDVDNIKSEDLVKLTQCPTCGNSELEEKKWKVRKGREEKVLWCGEHGPILGPGEFNYVRKESGEFLNKWKQKDDCQDIYQKLLACCPIQAAESWSKLLGYFYDEGYLSDGSREEFELLMNDFLLDIKMNLV
jgi:hypothetical protein